MDSKLGFFIIHDRHQSVGPAIIPHPRALHLTVQCTVMM